LAAIVAQVDYVARVNAAIERIASTRDQATVLELLRTCARALGAENATFVSFVRDDTDVASCRFMLACAPGWCQRYLDANCIAHDPWLAYAAHHGEPIVASALRVGDVQARRVIDLAAQHGFASAVLVPVHSGAGHSRISLLCLGSPQTGYFEDEGFGRFRLGARLLAAELHDWWMVRIRRELIVKARITPSDLELLRHEHLGHSSKRIAASLQVSTSSINSRFQRMNAKLGVPNRRIAARLAAECGLLD
jgi:DNA-binding CsgD family transcriptional regulator